MNLRISSRQSVLAKTQAFQVGAALQKADASTEIQFLFRESLGDKNLTDPLWKMPEKGVFTEDFYLDLVEGRTDLVVHSWKDLPTEAKPDTRIVATLPRADQRDLLLFKKTSLQKNQLRFFSSSPRRAFNLKEFFSWALPWSTDKLEFVSVRGNIQTRVQKLLSDPQVDGLIVAKAALDRLLIEKSSPETIEFLRRSLEECAWMVLPLSENPNAAAQGALAIEVAAERTDLLELMKQVNCETTFRSASREREILKEFGGGCHLALGMSVLERDYGRLEIVKGLSPGGEKIERKSFVARHPRPSSLRVGRLDFEIQRNAVPTEIASVEALHVSKAEAWPVGWRPGSQVIWTAGTKTWKKLAQQGVWVHGSSESLGESEDPMITILAGRELSWGRLTHDAAAESVDRKHFGTYHIELKILSQHLPDVDVLQWKSGSEFLKALEVFPQLRERAHVCGPGRTFECLQSTLGPKGRIWIEPHWE